MPTPFSIPIHPDDGVTGITLIRAAVAAVCRPGGRVVAGWDYCHTLPPRYPTEQAADAMLARAAQRIPAPCACFRFTARPGRKIAGLVPPLLLRRPGRVPFQIVPAIESLAASVRAGGRASWSPTAAMTRR